MTVKQNTAALKVYLADEFENRKFSVIDLKPFAMANGVAIKALTHSLGHMSRQGLIEKDGHVLNPNGGNPINRYLIPDVEKLTSRFPIKTDNDEKKKAKVMTDAAKNLHSALDKIARSHNGI